MSRWKYIFNSRVAAEKHLRQAERETNKRCFVWQVSIKAYLFKIFSCEEEFREYQRKKMERSKIS